MPYKSKLSKNEIKERLEWHNKSYKEMKDRNAIRRKAYGIWWFQSSCEEVISHDI